RRGGVPADGGAHDPRRPRPGPRGAPPRRRAGRRRPARNPDGAGREPVSPGEDGGAVVEEEERRYLSSSSPAAVKDTVEPKEQPLGVFGHLPVPVRGPVEAAAPDGPLALPRRDLAVGAVAHDEPERPEAGFPERPELFARDPAQERGFRAACRADLADRRPAR